LVLQKDIDDRKIEACCLEQLQCGRSAFRLDDFEMMDAQHDGNDRTDVGLIVNNKHARHRRLPIGRAAAYDENSSISAVPQGLFSRSVKRRLPYRRVFLPASSGNMYP
jgi:hypothetical protein